MKTNQFVCVVASFSLFMQPVGAAWAQNVTIHQGGQSASVVTATNGTDIVNITAPNAAGLSHNVYDQFNVGSAGLVLNNNNLATNSASNLTGLVPGNPNLMNGAAANVILNEVAGANQSDINGLIEVLGGSAHVVVANPNGIYCNGCGFIKAPQATLTTGRPVIGSFGELKAFDVHNGRIVIGPNGLDASAVELLDIIARQVDLNGIIAGKTIRVLAGTNRAVFASSGDVIEHQTLEGIAGAPVLAISSDAFGGMYGDKISVVATERGVGVAADVTMSASAGGMTLSSNGRLSLGHVVSKGAAQVHAQGDVTAGRIESENNIDLSGKSIQVTALTALGDADIAAADGDVTFVQMTAGGKMDIEALMGKVSSVMDDDEPAVNLFAQDRITIETQDFDVHRTLGQGVVVRADAIKADAIESRNADLELTARTGNIQAGSVMSNENVTLSAEQGSLAVGLAVAGGDLSATSAQGSATFETLSAVGSVDLDVQDALSAISITANDDIKIQANNVSGVKLLSGGAMEVGATGDIVVNQVVAGQDMKLNAGAVVASHLESWSGDMDLTLTHGGLAVDELVGGGNVSIEAVDGAVTMLSGFSQGYFAVTAQGIDILSVMAGLDLAALRESDILKFTENGHVVLMASQDDVDAARGAQAENGIVDATDASTLSAEDQWKINVGTMLATGSSYLSAETEVVYDKATTGADLIVRSNGGSLVSGSATTGGNLRISSDGNINFSRNSLYDNVDLDIGGVLEIDGYNVAMRNSNYTFGGLVINADNAISLQRATLTTRKDENGNNGHMVLSAKDLQTYRTKISAEGTMVLDIDGDLVNNFNIDAQEDLYILADRFLAQRNVVAGGNLVIGAMDETGAITQSKYLRADNRNFTALNGSVAVMTDLMSSTWLTSMNAQQGQLVVNADQFTGSRLGGLFGSYAATGSIDVSTQNPLDVRGQLKSGTQTRLFADNIAVNLAQDVSGGFLAAGKLDQDGRVTAAQSVTLGANLNGQDGDILIAADDIANNAGISTASGDIMMLSDRINAVGAINTQSGNLVLSGNESVTVDQGLNAGSGLSILTDTLVQNGNISAQGNILIGAAVQENGILGQTKSIETLAGTLESTGGDVIIALENATNLTDITAAGSVVLDTKVYDNDGKITAKTGSVAIAADQQMTVAGVVSAGQDVQMLSGDIAVTGDIQAGGNLLAAQGVNADDSFKLAAQFANTGQIAAGKSILVAAETANTGKMTAQGAGLSVMGQDVVVDGASAAGNMTFVAGNRLTLDQATAGANLLAASAGQIDITGAATASESVSLLGGTITSQTAGTVTAGQIAIAGEFDAETGALGNADALVGNGTFIATDGDVTVMANTIATDGVISAQSGNVAIFGDVAQSLGTVSAGQAVFAQMDTVLGADDGDTVTGQSITLLGNDIALGAASFVADQDVYIAGLMDADGNLTAAGTAQIAAQIIAQNGNVFMGLDQGTISGAVDAQAGNVTVLGQDLVVDGTLNAAENTYVLGQNSAAVNGTLTAGKELGLFAKAVTNNGTLTAGQDVFLGGAIVDNKPVAAQTIVNDGAILAQTGNVAVAVGEFNATGSITANQGDIWIDGTDIASTGTLNAQEFLRVNAQDGTITITDHVSGTNGTVVFGQEIDVARSGVVTSAQGPVLLGNGVGETGFIGRADHITVNGLVDGNGNPIHVSANTFDGRGTLATDGNPVSISVADMHFGGSVDAQDLGIFADNSLAIANVAVDGTFVGQSQNGDVNVTGKVTAGDVALIAGNFVNVQGANIDATGNADLGLAGNVLILGQNGVNIAGNTSYSGDAWATTTVYSTPAIITATNNVGILSNPQYEIDQELFDLYMLYMPSELPYAIDAIYQAVEGKEGNINITSGQIAAGNGVVIQGGELRFDALYTGSTCQLCATNTSLGRLETVIQSGNDTLANRSSDVDQTVPTSMTDWTTEDLVTALAGDKDIYVSGSSHVTGQATNFYADGELTLRSEYGSLEFHGWFDQGSWVGPSGYGQSGSYTYVNSATLSGNQGVTIAAPNGIYTNFSADVLSAMGDIVIHANQIEIAAFHDMMTQVDTSFAQTNGGWTTHAQSTGVSSATVHPVNLIAGGDLILSGATGIDITAANMASVGSTILQAGYDGNGNIVDENASITLNAGYNLSQVSTYDRKYGLSVGSRPDSNWNSMFGYDREAVGIAVQDVVSTNIIAGQDIVLIATGDVFGEAVNLQAGNDLNVTAGGNITFTSATAGSFTQKDTAWGSIGVGTKTSPGTASLTMAIQTENSTDMMWKPQAVGSTLVAGGNVNLSSGGDVTIQGSSITAGQTLGITADGSVNIIDAQSGTVALGYEHSTFMGWTFKVSQPFVTAVVGAQNAYENLNSAIEAASGSLTDIKTPADAAARVDAMANLYHAQQSFKGAMEGLQGQIETYATFLTSEDKDPSSLTLVNLNATFTVSENTTTTSSSTSTSSGSSLNAQDILITAGQDVTIEGSEITAVDLVEIVAGNNVNIFPGWNTTSSHSHSHGYNFNVGISGSIDGAGGFNPGSISASYNTYSNTSQSGSTEAVSSVISGSTVNIVAGNDINGVGAILEGQDIYLTAGNNINFVAAQNSFYGSTENMSMGISASVSLGSSGISGFGLGMSQELLFSQASGTSNVYSMVTAQNQLVVTSGNDTNLIGAVFEGDDVILNVGGDLNIVTLQDTFQASGNWQYIDVNASFDGNFKPTSASFDYGSYEFGISTATVSQQSGIIGNNSVTISVGGNTHLAGATITAPTVDLTTGSLSLSNVYNHEIYTENSLNFGFNLNFTSDNLGDFLQDLDPYGSSSSGFFSNFWATTPYISAETVTVGGVEYNTADLNTHFALRHNVTKNVGYGIVQQIQDIDALMSIRDELNTLAMASN